MSDSLQPHELQHARPPCPSPTPRVHPNSRPLSRCCHPAMLSSVVPFSSCPQSLPASEPFPMSQLFAWGGQSTGVSALASVLPMNTQDWYPLEWTGWISLLSKGLSIVFSNTKFKSIHSLALSFLHSPTFTSIHDHWKTIALTRWTFVKLTKSSGSWEKEESSRKTSISALLTMPKPLTVWITINCGKFCKRWEY